MRGVGAVKTVALGLASNILFWILSSGATGIGLLWLWDQFGGGPSFETAVLYVVGLSAVTSVALQVRLYFRRPGDRLSLFKEAVVAGIQDAGQSATMEAITEATRGPARGNIKDAVAEAIDEAGLRRRPRQPDEPKALYVAGDMLQISAEARTFDVPWELFNSDVLSLGVAGLLSFAPKPVLVAVKVRSVADRILQGVRLRIEEGLVRAVISQVQSSSSLRGISMPTSLLTVDYSRPPAEPTVPKFDPRDLTLSVGTLEPGRDWTEMLLMEPSGFGDGLLSFRWYLYVGDQEVGSNTYERIKVG